MRLHILLLSVFFSLTCKAQELDSLIIQLEPTPPGEQRVDLLNRIVTGLRERNVYRAVKFGTEAKTLAEKLNYKEGLGLAMENLGWIYYRRGIYSSAFQLSKDALQISEELGDSTAMARCLNNVAAISYERAQYDEAIRNFKRGYELAAGKNDTETVVRSLNNVAFAFLGLRRPDSAQFYAKLALEKSKLDRGGYMPAFTYRILGDIAVERGDMDAAMKNFNESMRISEATNNYFIQASTLHRIGKVYFRQGNYLRALEVLNRNVIIAKRNGYADELERTYKLISDINNSRHEVTLAFDYLQRHLAIHDSLSNQRNSEQMALMSAQFESELKQSQIELLTQDAKIREEEISRQRAWSYVYAGGLIVVILIVGILYYSYRRIKKVNDELQVKTDQVEKQAAELANLNQTKDKLISIISHDIRSPLASLRGMLNIAQSGNVSPEEFTHLTGQVGAYLDSVYDDLGNLLQWTNTQLHGFKANFETFELLPLTEEVIMLFSKHALSKGVTVKNELKNNLLVIADRNHIKIILRNLLANAIKFSSGGDEIVIKQKDKGTLIEIAICDTGVGVSKEDIPKLFNMGSHFTKSGTANEKGMGVGLLLTKEFVEKNGGSINVESELGKGSTFSFTLRKG